MRFKYLYRPRQQGGWVPESKFPDPNFSTTTLADLIHDTLDHGEDADFSVDDEVRAQGSAIWTLPVMRMLDVTASGNDNLLNRLREKEALGVTGVKVMIDLDFLSRFHEQLNRVGWRMGDAVHMEFLTLMSQGYREAKKRWPQGVTYDHGDQQRLLEARQGSFKRFQEYGDRAWRMLDVETFMTGRHFGLRMGGGRD